MSFNCDSDEFNLPSQFYTDATPDRCDVLQNLCSSHRCFRDECRRYKVTERCSAVKLGQLEKNVFEGISNIILAADRAKYDVGDIGYVRPGHPREHSQAFGEHPFHWHGHQPAEPPGEPEKSISRRRTRVAFWPHFYTAAKGVGYTVYVFPEEGTLTLKSLSVGVVKTKEFVESVLKRKLDIMVPETYRSTFVLPDFSEVSHITRPYVTMEGPTMVPDAVSAVIQAMIR